MITSSQFCVQRAPPLLGETSGIAGITEEEMESLILATEAMRSEEEMEPSIRTPEAMALRQRLWVIKMIWSPRLNL